MDSGSVVRLPGASLHAGQGLWACRGSSVITRRGAIRCGWDRPQRRRFNVGRQKAAARVPRRARPSTPGS